MSLNLLAARARKNHTSVIATGYFDPAKKGVDIVLSNSNRSAATTAVNNWESVFGSASRSTGKYYFEVRIRTTGSQFVFAGLGKAASPTANYVGSDVNGWGFSANGTIYYNGALVVNTGITFANNDIMGIAWDADAGKAWFSKNGVFDGSPSAGTGNRISGVLGTLFPVVSLYTSPLAADLRLAPSDFIYAPPTGFKAFNYSTAQKARWRVYINSDNGNGNVSIEELFLFSAYGTNAATGGTATADSQFNATYVPPNAIDGLSTKRWAALGTNPFPHWLAVQLTAPSALDFVNIRVGADAGQNGSDAPKDFKIQSSNDGISWTDEWSVTGQDGWIPGGTRRFARGGSPVGWNPADIGPGFVLSAGNLKLTRGGGSNVWGGVRANLPRDAATANHYFEFVATDNVNNMVGVSLVTQPVASTRFLGDTAGGWAHSGSAGIKINNNVQTAWGAAWGAGDVVGTLLKNGKLYFRKNGVWMNSADPIAETGWAFSGIAGNVYPAASMFTNNSNSTVRFKTSDLSGSLPAGTVAWDPSI